MPGTTCPHCRLGIQVEVTAYEDPAHSSDEVAKWGIGPCPLCSKPMFLKWEADIDDEEGVGKVTFTYPLASNEASEDIPEGVREFYEEALRCVEGGAPNGSLVMSRRALDESLKGLGAPKGDLPTRLNYLVTNYKITPDLKEWADHARIGGRLAAHGTGGDEWGDEALVKGSKENALEVLGFLESFF